MLQNYELVNQYLNHEIIHKYFIMNKLDRILFNAINQSDEAGIVDAIIKGADVNSIDGCGMTPIMVATILKSDLKIIKHLIKNGAEINVHNPYGNTAIMFAAIMDKEIYQCLLENGGDPTIRNSDGRTARDYNCEIMTLKEIVVY